MGSSTRATIQESPHERRRALYAKKDAQSEDFRIRLRELSLEMSRLIPAIDVNVHCTEFAIDGTIKKTGKVIDKATLTVDYDLQARDLRKLDLDSSALPYIFVRPKTIIINLQHLRLLIQYNRILVVETEESTDIRSLFTYNLEHRIQSTISSHLPFELRAMEAVLVTLTAALEAEMILIRGPVVEILQELKQGLNIDQAVLRDLLSRSEKLVLFEQSARQNRDALQELLDADDDLAEMYLTDSRNSKPHAIEDHIEAEILLETYHKICDGIVESCERLQDDVENTDKTIRAILDANRNQIMLLDLQMTMGALGLGAATTIAGLYGMNTVNFLEDSHSAFFVISAACFTACAVVVLVGRRLLRRIQWHRIRDRRR